MGGSALFSQAEVQPSRARLVVDCKGAPESAADLRNADCRSAVLGHLEREFGIESVVLSHYVERQYGARAMGALRHTLSLASLLTQLGTRPPAPNFPGATKKQVAAKCRECPYRPKTLFGRLRELLLGDFARFHAAFTEITGRLHRYHEVGCRTCTAGTANDLIYVFQEAVGFGEACLRAGEGATE